MAKMTLSLSPLQRRLVAKALLALAALMVVDVLFQAGMHVTWRVWVNRRVRALQALAVPATQPAKPEKNQRPPELAEALRNRNIFTTPRPTDHGMRLTGVIGDLALFATREGATVSAKEGESSGPIKVKSINGYEVVIEFKGKPETMKLFNDAGGGGGGGGGGGRMAPPPGGAPSMPATVMQMDGAVQIATPGGMPPGIDMSNLPPEVRQQLEKRMMRKGTH